MSRFEMDVDGATAFANYRVVPGAIVITHTETPQALRGRGIASQLVEGALELIEAKGNKVVAAAASWSTTSASTRGGKSSTPVYNSGRAITGRDAMHRPGDNVSRVARCARF